MQLFTFNRCAITRPLALFLALLLSITCFNNQGIVLAGASNQEASNTFDKNPQAPNQGLFSVVPIATTHLERTPEGFSYYDNTEYLLSYQTGSTIQLQDLKVTLPDKSGTLGDNIPAFFGIENIELSYTEEELGNISGSDHPFVLTKKTVWDDFQTSYDENVGDSEQEFMIKLYEYVQEFYDATNQSGDDHFIWPQHGDIEDSEDADYSAYGGKDNYEYLCELHRLCDDANGGTDQFYETLVNESSSQEVQELHFFIRDRRKFISSEFYPINNWKDGYQDGDEWHETDRYDIDWGQRNFTYEFPSDFMNTNGKLTYSPNDTTSIVKEYFTSHTDLKMQAIGFLFLPEEQAWFRFTYQTLPGKIAEVKATNLATMVYPSRESILLYNEQNQDNQVYDHEVYRPDYMLKVRYEGSDEWADAPFAYNVQAGEYSKEQPEAQRTIDLYVGGKKGSYPIKLMEYDPDATLTVTMSDTARTFYTDWEDFDPTGYTFTYHSNGQDKVLTYGEDYLISVGLGELYVYYNGTKAKITIDGNLQDFGYNVIERCDPEGLNLSCSDENNPYYYYYLGENRPFTLDSLVVNKVYRVRDTGKYYNLNLSSNDYEYEYVNYRPLESDNYEEFVNGHYPSTSMQAELHVWTKDDPSCQATRTITVAPKNVMSLDVLQYSPYAVRGRDDILHDNFYVIAEYEDGSKGRCYWFDMEYDFSSPDEHQTVLIKHPNCTPVTMDVTLISEEDIPDSLDVEYNKDSKIYDATYSVEPFDINDGGNLTVWARYNDHPEKDRELTSSDFTPILDPIDLYNNQAMIYYLGHWRNFEVNRNTFEYIQLDNRRSFFHLDDTNSKLGDDISIKIIGSAGDNAVREYNLVDLVNSTNGIDGVTAELTYYPNYVKTTDTSTLTSTGYILGATPNVEGKVEIAVHFTTLDGQVRTENTAIFIGQYEKHIESLYYDGNTYRNILVEGEQLDYSKVKLMTWYDYEAEPGRWERVEEEIPYTQLSITAEGNWNANESGFLRVRYHNEEWGLSIQVIPKLITHIEMITPPTKSEYSLGEQLNTNGLEVLAHYNDGTSDTVPVTDLTFSSIKAESGIQYVEATYDTSYRNFTCKFAVYVNAKEVVKPLTLCDIKVVNNGKTEYYVGDSFNKSGLTVTGIYSDGSIKTITNYSLSISLSKKGIAKGTVTYLGKTASFHVYVTTVDLSKGKLTCTKTLTYTGSSLSPTVTVTYGSIKLVKNVDYTVSYKNNKEVGTATVTVTGKGRYFGVLTTNFTITLGQARISKVTGKSKSLEVKLSSVKGASGYEYSYSTKSKSGFKVITSTSKTTYVISKLSKAKYYYVRVRAYRSVSGKKVYGPYSTVIKAKTK